MCGATVEFDPPNEPACKWPHDKGPGTVVTVKLTAMASGTLLKLTYARLASEEFRKGVCAGWHAHLELLLDLTSQQPARDFRRHYPSLEAEYDKS